MHKLFFYQVHKSCIPKCKVATYLPSFDQSIIILNLLVGISPNKLYTQYCTFTYKPIITPRLIKPQPTWCVSPLASHWCGPPRYAVGPHWWVPRAKTATWYRRPKFWPLPRHFRPPPACTTEAIHSRVRHPSKPTVPAGAYCPLDLLP